MRERRCVVARPGVFDPDLGAVDAQPAATQVQADAGIAALAACGAFEIDELERVERGAGGHAQVERDIDPVAGADRTQACNDVGLGHAICLGPGLGEQRQAGARGGGRGADAAAYLLRDRPWRGGAPPHAQPTVEIIGEARQIGLRGGARRHDPRDQRARDEQ